MLTTHSKNTCSFFILLFCFYDQIYRDKEDILTQLNLPQNVFDVLTENIRRRMNPQRIKIYSEIEVFFFTFLIESFLFLSSCYVIPPREYRELRWLC